MPISSTNSDSRYPLAAIRLISWAATHRWELALVVLCTLASAIIRVYRLEDLPPGFHGDEALTGLDAIRIMSQGWIGPYTGSALGQPTGPLYFTALLFELSNPSLFTVRLSMALLGIATVPLTYILFRLSFGRWIAIVGTIALVTSFWHIHYSRTGFMVISMPLIISVGSLLLLLAMRSRRLWLWFVTGLVLGLGIYSYNGYPGFLLALAAFLGIQLWMLRSRWQQLTPRIALLISGLCLVALPMIQFARESPQFYLSHFKLVSSFSDHRYEEAESAVEKLEYFRARVWDSYTLLLRHPNIDFTDATGGRGALNFLLALLAYFGLAVSSARWRSPPHLLFALTVFVGLSVLVFTAPDWGDMRRSLIAVPFVFGLVGVAAREIALLGRRFRGETGYRVALIGISALIVVSTLGNIDYYFRGFVERDETMWVFADNLVDSLEAAHSYDNPGTIYFFSGRWSYHYETRKFLYPNTTGIDRSREFGDLFSLEKTTSGPVTYVLLHPYTSELKTLKDMYPNGGEIKGINEFGGMRFAVYHVP